MGAKFTELHCKEVVCVSDGRRLGFIEDVIIELPNGEVNAIVVPGRCRCLGLLNPREDYVIPWHSICRIGPDIVLVDTQPDTCRCHRAKPRLPF
ncbi:MAG: YlmC/YmxH family sporulation protein [Oscillospiraceae bacterium]|nr:YlmC/YmxH family sporulation protein [Oscillospiraceae bacterium]